MSVLVRRVNGYDVYIHDSTPQSLHPIGALHLTRGRPDDPILSCRGIDCSHCPVGFTTRQATFGVSDRTGEGCRLCSRHILGSTTVYRRSPC